MQIADVLAKYFTRCAEFSSPMAHIRSNISILTDLLGGIKVSNESIHRFVNKNNLVSPWQLLVFKHNSRNDYSYRSSLIRALESLKTDNISLEYDSVVLSVTQEAKSQALIAELDKVFDISCLCIGISMPFADFKTLPIQYRQAMFSVEYARSQGVFYCKDFAFPYLVETLSKQKMALELTHPALEIIYQYDEQNNTELLKTLFVYLSEERNHNHTSRLLNLHRNTLKYRLDRIKSLTSINLSSIEERAHLSLSFWINTRKHSDTKFANILKEINWNT